VIDDASGGDLRARAGMLRAIARGRGLAAGQPGFTPASYLAALRAQIRQFPDDPATGEARWLVGLARKQAGAATEAEMFWNSVPRSHPRWLDSRIGLAQLRRQSLEESVLVDDPSTVAKSCEDARAELERACADARDEAERTDLEIEAVRLELLPAVGDPQRALAAVERLKSLPLRQDQREILEAHRVVALAVSGKSLDAERAAGKLEAPPEVRLGVARLLDRWAVITSSDLLARRVAGTERLVADRLATESKNPPEMAAEIRLRRARSRWLAGDLEGARGLSDGWLHAEAQLPNQLDDLGELWAEVGRNSEAESIFRKLASSQVPGTGRWFQARLGQIRALFAAGRIDEADRLLEGTALLHPKLGGPAMQRRYGEMRSQIARKAVPKPRVSSGRPN
jgi:tetratricopeptide (TPR) repeat protein